MEIYGGHSKQMNILILILCCQTKSGDTVLHTVVHYREKKMWKQIISFLFKKKKTKLFQRFMK